MCHVWGKVGTIVGAFTDVALSLILVGIHLYASLVRGQQSSSGEVDRLLLINGIYPKLIIGMNHNPVVPLLVQDRGHLSEQTVRPCQIAASIIGQSRNQLDGGAAKLER